MASAMVTPAIRIASIVRVTVMSSVRKRRDRRHSVARLSGHARQSRQAVIGARDA